MPINHILSLHHIVDSVDIDTALAQDLVLVDLEGGELPRGRLELNKEAAPIVGDEQPVRHTPPTWRGEFIGKHADAAGVVAYGAFNLGFTH